MQAVAQVRQKRERPADVQATPKVSDNAARQDPDDPFRLAILFTAASATDAALRNLPSLTELRRGSKIAAAKFSSDVVPEAFDRIVRERETLGEALDRMKGECEAHERLKQKGEKYLSAPYDRLLRRWVQDRLETLTEEEARVSILRDCAERYCDSNPQAAPRFSQREMMEIELILRKIAQIPRLQRDEEIALAEDLDHVRNNFQKKLCGSRLLRWEILELYRKVADGSEAVKSVFRVGHGGDTEEKMLARVTVNLATIDRITASYQGARILPIHEQRIVSLLSDALLIPSRLVALKNSYVAHLKEIKSMVATGEAKTRRGSRTVRQRLGESVEDAWDRDNEIRTAWRSWRETRSAFSEANLRLAVAVSKKYRGKGLSLGDLVSEAQRGLLLAVDKFQRLSGFKFSTVGTWWIKQMIRRALHDQSRTIRRPAHANRDYAKLSDAAELLMHTRRREVGVEEAAAGSDLTAKRVKAATSSINQPLHLDARIDEDDTRLGDYIEDKHAGPTAHAVAVHKTLAAKLETVIGSLAPREREIIKLRFGFHDGQTYTLDQIARFYGITRERVRQIEAAGLKKLRHPIRSNELKDFAPEGWKAPRE